MKKVIKALVICLVFSIVISCEKKTVPPVVLTNNATEISTVSATAGGIIKDNGGAEITAKGICWNTVTGPDIENSKTSEPGSAMSFTSNITGLLPNTTYYVRAYATNSAGVSYGLTKSFKTTGDKASPFTHAASAVQTTIATLNGIVNANSLETTVTFEYGISVNYGNIALAQQSPLTGSTNENVSANLTQLTPGTIYHFRIKAVNTLGTTYSDDVTFTTTGLTPSVVALDASNITITSSTLNGQVNPNSLETTVTFQYGITTSYGNSVTVVQSPLTGALPENVSAQLTSLTPGTNFHFRLKAVNLLGTTYSDDISFTTPGQLSSISGGKSQDITGTTATLAGSVNPNYLSTSVVFEWGSTLSYGNTATPSPGTINGHESTNLSVGLTGLNAGAAYHYRIKATNQLGTSVSGDMVFSTDLTDIEGNIYHTVPLGNQVWTSENLRVTKYNDGSSIAMVTDNTLWSSTGTAAYSWYNNDMANKNLYGGYYNWYVVDKSYNGNKNVCPAGWHIPTKSEWLTFFNFLSQNGYGFEGRTEYIAKSIASTSGWESVPGESLVGRDQQLNNTSGFNGMPAGTRSYNGAFNVLSRWAGWWAQPDNYSLGYSPWYNVITQADYKPTTISLGNTYGASIRCIKN
ncbi:MAG: FISUMP domain-containing protein [Methanosarcina sp.]